jgi:hypothetical protein
MFIPSLSVSAGLMNVELVFSWLEARLGGSLAWRGLEVSELIKVRVEASSSNPSVWLLVRFEVEVEWSRERVWVRFTSGLDVFSTWVELVASTV